jgi:sporulation protein YlmC with PRC-barrel domain
MKSARASRPGMAPCVGLLAIAAFSNPASAADIHGDWLRADRAIRPGVLLVDAGVDEQADPQKGTGELYNKAPRDIIGMDVVDVDGETVGTVDDLVMDKAISTVSVVIAVDRILGLVGGKRVVIPLDTLQVRGDALQIALNKDQVRTSPEYVEEYYVPIPEQDERPISDYLASDAKAWDDPALPRIPGNGITGPTGGKRANPFSAAKGFT